MTPARVKVQPTILVSAFRLTDSQRVGSTIVYVRDFAPSIDVKHSIHPLVSPMKRGSYCLSSVAAKVIPPGWKVFPIVHTRTLKQPQPNLLDFRD